MQTYDTYKKMARAAIGFSILCGVAAFAIVIFSSLSSIPDSYAAFVPPAWGAIPAVVLGFAAGFVGTRLRTLVQSWQWEDAGREVGLAPAKDGLPRDLSQDDHSSVGKAILSGRVRGRPVRARSYTSKSSSGGEGSSKSVTVTVVEADLNQSAAGGVIVNSASGGFTDSAEGGPDAENGELAAISDQESHAQALISGRVRDALDQLDTVGQLFVGDAETVFREAIPDLDGADEGLGVWGSSTADKRVAFMNMGMDIDIEGDAKTVTHRVTDPVLAPDELEREVEAVVTVAEVYEELRREDR